MGGNPQIGPVSSLPPLKAVKVLDQLRERIRTLHYSRRIEEVHVHGRRVFFRFSGVRQAAALRAAAVDGCLFVCPGS